MNLRESLRIAVSSLLLNRTRALLTMLGIIIGVGAVIALIGLGRGVETSVASQFEGLGADTLTVRGNPPRFGTSTATQPLTIADAEALAALPGVKQVAAEYQVQGTVVYERNSSNSSVRGVSANFFAVNDWYPAVGSIFSTGDLEEQAQIALVGSDMVDDLFDGANPVGQTILINNRAFTVVGVMEEKSSSGFNNQNSAILVPITTAQTRLGNARVVGGYDVSSLSVQVNDVNDIDAAKSRVEAFLLAEHGITNSTEADFQIQNPSTIVEFANVGHQHTHAVSQWNRGHLAARGRHRRHEHHARVCLRAHAGNRAAQGRRRTLWRHPQPVPDGKHPTITGGRSWRHPGRLAGDAGRLVPAQPFVQPERGCRAAGGGRQHRYRRLFRLVPCQSRRAHAARAGPEV